MASTTQQEVDLLRDLRGPSMASGGVFWRDDQKLMVFDADAAVQANSANFADLTMPDRLVDVIRRRSSPAVSWKQVRAAWLAQLRQLTDETELAALDHRMEQVLHARLNRPVNLPWLSHEVSFRSLVPIVIAGLSTKDQALITEDALVKLNRLMRPSTDDRPLWRTPRRLAVGLRAGLVIRRELRRRARRRVPLRRDLTEPIATQLLGALGMDRALHSVAAVLTAIAGPPGASAANMMYALVTHPDWAERLAAEFDQVSLSELYGSATRCVPTAHRFVREVLRIWPSPTMMTRSVRAPMQVANHCLRPGQQYIVSPSMVHHDRQYWPDHEAFDPDRWLPGAANGLRGGQHYVPFGWAPTACVGAGLGTIQLVLLCRQLCTKFRIEVTDPSALRMSVAAVALPVNFDGRVVLRI
jgi:cytochrome P450